MTAETALYLRLRGEVICIQGRSAVVGRSASCDVQVDEQGVSRRHCEVLLKDDGATVRDLGSSRGTYVSGVRVEGEARLAPGVLVSLGQHGTHFEVVNAIVHGHPVLGAGVRPPTMTAIPLPSESEMTTATIREIPALAAPPTPPKSRFVAGLVWGLAAGVIVGLAAVALI